MPKKKIRRHAKKEKKIAKFKQPNKGEKEDSLPKEGNVVFIDGSCYNPGKKVARAGYGIVFPDKCE
jgi:hypothetical protein